MKNFDVLSCTVRPKAGCQSVRKENDQYSSLFTTPGTDRQETGIINGWAPPSVYLPCVYLMAPHVTRYPRPSLAVFQTGIVVVGMAWEQG